MISIGEDVKTCSDDFLRGQWCVGAKEDGTVISSMSIGHKRFHWEIEAELKLRGYAKPVLKDSAESKTGKMWVIEKIVCPECQQSKLNFEWEQDTAYHHVLDHYTCPSCKTDFVSKNGYLDISASSYA